MTNSKSINPLEKTLSYIKNAQFPYLTKIIVKNKSDIAPEKEDQKIKKFLNFFSFINTREISVKTGENIDDLLNEIYKAVNPKSPNNNLLPINQVRKSDSNKFSKMKYDGVVSLILVGDQNVGKSNFLISYAVMRCISHTFHI